MPKSKLEVRAVAGPEMDAAVAEHVDNGRGLGTIITRYSSGSYVTISPAGRLEVDGRKLMQSPKVQRDMARLKEIHFLKK